MGYICFISATGVFSASSHRHDNTCHGHCYTSSGVLFRQETAEQSNVMEADPRFTNQTNTLFPGNAPILLAYEV